MCSFFGAKVRVGELAASNGGLEALLVPLPDNEFGISVDPTPRGGWDRVPRTLRQSLRRHRLRFRVAHELAHTFFYIRQQGATPQRHLFDSDEQEEFCDFFSRSLLISRERVMAMAATPRALVRLQEESDVSLEVTARAVAAVRPDLDISIWFESPDQGLELQWSTGERSGDGRKAVRPELLQRQPATLWIPQRQQLIAIGQS